MKLTKGEKPDYKLFCKGSIIDKNADCVNFTEKDVVHIEIKQGNENLFYEVNDEFRRLKKIKERLKKLLEMGEYFDDYHFRIKKILEGKE